MPIFISIIDFGNRYTYDQIRELTDVSRTEDIKLSLFFSWTGIMIPGFLPEVHTIKAKN